jgi:pyruvate,water dikinase
MITADSYVMKLEEAGNDSPGAGQKAIALSGMARSGIPVPPGFVLTQQAFEKFAKSNKLEGRIAGVMKGLNPDDFQSLREVSENIQSIIINSAMPDVIGKEMADAYEELSVGKEAREVGGVALDLIRAGRGEAWVAVRASPAGGFMEQGRSLLNVRGNRKICEAVKQCWSSLFTPGAMLHRRKGRIEGFPSMAVIVQKMVDAEKSGNMFTYQPETQDRSRMVIEGVLGLGEIMHDAATPDEYLIDKETGKLVEKKVRKKIWLMKRDAMSGQTIREPVSRRDSELDALNDSELIKLWELALRIERQNGSHRVGWCMERGRIFVVGSGPIGEFPMPAEECAPSGKPVAQGLGIYPGLAKGSAKIVTGPADLQKVNPGDILVTRMTSDAMMPAFSKISGIVTDSGARTCHAARAARELGIPCVVGTGSVTTVLRDDQAVEVNGMDGRVYFDEPEPARPVPTHAAGMPGQLPRIRDAAAQPWPGYREPQMDDRMAREREGFTATQVRASITLPDMAERAKEADGIGLVRAEHLLSESGRHPMYLARTSPGTFSDILHRSLERISRAVYPKPVFYRGLDVRTDEFRQLEGGDEEPDETNPMLGWHGIRRTLDEPELLRLELDVLRRLHQDGMKNIMLVLPFISSVEELRRTRGFLDFPIKTGIMVETPAAALNIENFCREGIDFVSIGFDDLSQLVLGVDRDNASVSRLYTGMNPAMSNLVRHVVRTCRKYGVRVSVCGWAGSDPGSVETLVEMGVDSVTADIESLGQAREAVSRAERKLLLDRARSLGGPE